MIVFGASQSLSDSQFPAPWKLNVGFSGACLVPVGFVALVSFTDANFEHKPFLHTFGILAHLLVNTELSSSVNI
jgi:hypothetical protein